MVYAPITRLALKIKIEDLEHEIEVDEMYLKEKKEELEEAVKLWKELK